MAETLGARKDPQSLTDGQRRGNTFGGTDALTSRETGKAAQTLGISFKAYGVDGLDDYDRALSAIVAERAGAVLVATGSLFFGHGRHLADLALKHRLPTMFAFRE